MKGSIEILIRENGVLIGSPFAKEEGEFLPHPVSDLGSHLVRYCAPKNPTSQTVIFYVAEELLFYKRILLPLQTKNLTEAVSYQLEMLTPFEGPMLHSYTAIRKKEGYSVSLYALLAETVTPYLDEVAAQGFDLAGLFPESQRYVTRASKKQEWALLMPGRLPKLLIFSEAHIQDRLLCHSQPSLDGLRAVSARERIYSPSAGAGNGFENTSALLAEKALHKEFNLLPASYRRPDYLRYILMALCALNICALLAVGGVKEYNILTTLSNLETTTSTLLPQVKEVEQLRLQEKKLSESFDRLEEIGQNFDIIRFLDKMTKTLPDNCYIDQVRLDQHTGAIQLQGYTEDLTELTAILESLDQAKLKSTRRRKNQTYFSVEISGT